MGAPHGPFPRISWEGEFLCPAGRDLVSGDDRIVTPRQLELRPVRGRAYRRLRRTDTVHTIGRVIAANP